MSDKCQCNMRTRLVGDGCRHCNPDFYIDLIQEQLAEANAENERLREQYNDLIMSVASKFPNETRHETAKRYIQSVENCIPRASGKALAELKEKCDED